MNGGALYSHGTHIHDAIEELLAAWVEAEQLWNDSVSRRFCEEHLEPLGPIVKLALDSTFRMSHVVNQMHHDCES
jgi:hypothetical protein